MAQTSRRLKRARRTKRHLTLAHRQYDRLVREARPVLRRGQMEGRILRAILARSLDAVTIPEEVLDGTLSYTGDIDVALIPGSTMAEIRYVSTPLEQSKVEAVTGSDPITIDGPTVSYAEPEAAV